MSLVTEKPVHFRSSISTGSPRVSRDAGMFESGLITDLSIITRGEALGHDVWVDQDFLSDIAASINESAMTSATGGMKARFTHPGLSSDGTGQKLGRVRDARVEGDQVIADLHFQKAATRTPDGDLADYVMTLAEETPEDFGLSIVFSQDLEAIEDHVLRNTQGNRYVSPDEDNKNNYKHAMLSELRSADVVDSPAANPDGLFQRGQEAAKEGEALLEYALGLSDAKPSTSRFSVDPDRMAIFVTRFLERHELSVQKKVGDFVSDAEQPADEAPTRESFAAELDRYVERFGAESGSKWFSEGVPYAESLELHFESLQAEIETLTAKVEELEEVITSLDRGDDEGAEFGIDTEEPAPAEKSLRNRIRINGIAANN